jgi:ParB/RepB/Spo0J family partition protein
MNAPTAPAVLQPARAEYLPLSIIIPSSTNPRKHFDEAALAELTDSVRRHGVLQPVLVRPNKTKDGKPLRDYELVAGERRYRAAKAAELENIPALVRDLTDVEVLEMQIVENLQREGLHELEEAEGYESLTRRHHYTVDQIAEKIGKSRRYVFARMQLLTLSLLAREAFYAGKLNASTALLVARIPVADLQAKAIKEIVDGPRYGHDAGEPMSYRAAREHLEREYMLLLAKAPFDVNDSELLKKAGSCTACPKRTGNQRDLFADIKNANVCTDPVCFSAKRNVATERKRAAAIANGQKVISGKEAARLVPCRGADHLQGGSLIALSAKCYEDSKTRTYSEILGKDCPLPTLVEDPHGGGFIEALPERTVKDLLKAKLPSIKKREEARSSQSKEQRKQAEKAKLETKVREAVFLAAREKILKIVSDETGYHPLGPTELALLADACFERADYNVKKRVIELWSGPEAPKVSDSSIWTAGAKFAKSIPSLTQRQHCLLILDTLLIEQIPASHARDDKAERLYTVASTHKIDAAKIRAHLVADAEEKKKAKAPKKKPVAKSAGRNGSAPKAAAPKKPRQAKGKTAPAKPAA